MENNEKKKSKLGTIIITLSVLLFVGGIGMALFLATVSAGLVVLGVFLSIIGLTLLLTIIIAYNSIIHCKNKVKESLSLIDVHLKLRFDLIPNLVSTVKGYAKHESELFQKLVKLRSLGVETENEGEKINIANKTVILMRQTIAVAERYPDLKSSAVFKALMDELTLIEDKLVAARRFYDSNVNIYNTKIEVWPNNIIANIFGFTREELFVIEAGERIKPETGFEE